MAFSIAEEAALDFEILDVLCALIDGSLRGLRYLVFGVAQFALDNLLVAGFIVGSDSSLLQFRNLLYQLMTLATDEIVAGDFVFGVLLDALEHVVGSGFDASVHISQAGLFKALHTLICPLGKCFRTNRGLPGKV